MYLLVNVLKFVAVYLVTGLVMPWVYSVIILGVLIHRYGYDTPLCVVNSTQWHIDPLMYKLVPVILLTWPIRYPSAADQTMTMLDSACKEYVESHSEKKES